MRNAQLRPTTARRCGSVLRAGMNEPKCKALPAQRVRSAHSPGAVVRRNMAPQLKSHARTFPVSRELRVTNDAAHPTAPVVRLCPGRRRNAKSVREGAYRLTGDARMAEGAEQQAPPDALCLWVPEIFAAIEHLGLFGNAELLRAHLTLQTEFVHVIVNPSTGEVSRIPRSWAYSSLDENEFAEMAKQIRDYLLGDFGSNCASSARQMGRKHGAAFSDGGGSMTRTNANTKPVCGITAARSARESECRAVQQVFITSESTAVAATCRK